MKNKLMLVSLFLVAFLITIGAALADIQASPLELGSSSQERGENIVSHPWTIKNTGTETITDLAVAFIGTDDKYNATVTLATTTLAENESTDALVTIFVPLDQDSGNKKLNGNIQATATGLTNTQEIFLETVNHLVINEIKVEVGTRDDTLKSPGKVDRDADLGDDIELKIEIENTFDENIEIEDIDIDTNSDLDEADDLDDSISSLEDGENEKITFSFIIDEEEVDPNDAPFTITVTVKGIDENDAIHREEWDIELDMNVNSRDVRVTDVSLSKSVLKCGDTLSINYDLRNVGKRDTDDAMVKFEETELNIGMWERDLEIYTDDIESFSSSLKIPEDAEEGIYILEMTVYATDSTSDDTDEETLSFELRTCEEEEKEDEKTVKDDDEGTGTVIITPPTVGGDDDTTNGGTPAVVPAVPVTSSTGSSKSPLGDATAYIIVLGIIVLLLLIAVVVLLAKVASK